MARPVLNRPVVGLVELETLQVERLAMPGTQDGSDDVTSPSMRPAVAVAVDHRAPQGELAALLRNSVPVLWSLDDCARFLDDLAAHHVSGADTHAKTVRLVARLLAQMQSRANDVDPMR